MQEAYFGELQHGHMEQVGYDTYCKLLEEVVKEMQGMEVKEELDVQIDVNVSSYIPDEFLQSGSQKIEIYQDIALCRTEEDIANVIDEIIDRYGTMPQEVENLIQIARIKQICRNLGIIKLAQKGNKVILTFEPNAIELEDITSLIVTYKGAVKFSPGATPYLTYTLKETKETKMLEEIKEVLKKF